MTDVLRLAQAAVERIEDPATRSLNAVVSYDREVLLGQARKLEGCAAAGPLAGLTLGVKDNICTLEYPTTCASRILEGYRSPFEATAVGRLKEAGCLVACTTNLDEFAMGSSTEFSTYGPTEHPFAPGRVPGGSSGGSAALVAAEAVDAALGSETGGSVRQPAAFCGIVGIKPTYGRVSRYGLVAFGSSLDQIGVFARSVGRAAQILCVMSGRDDNDATSADRDPMTSDEAPADLSNITIGVPREYLPEGLDPGVREACDRVVSRMRQLGATIREVSLPNTVLAVPAYYVVACAEASANLARYDGVRFGRRVCAPDSDLGAMYRSTRGAGFGPEVRRRIIVGTYVLSAGYYDAYYLRALSARRRIMRDFSRVFDGGVDLLVAPTTPTTAFRAGEKIRHPVAMYLSDVFVCPANLALVPAISIPIGRCDGLPVGAQLIAPWFHEARLIGVAAVIERSIDARAEL